MSFTNEQYVNGVKKLILIYKSEWINRMRVFLRYIDEHCTDNNFGDFPAMIEELRRIVNNGGAVITRHMSLMERKNFPEVDDMRDYKEITQDESGMERCTPMPCVTAIRHDEEDDRIPEPDMLRAKLDPNYGDKYLIEVFEKMGYKVNNKDKILGLGSNDGNS